ncbi:MAG: rRNA pseudouridine synthase, partial [Proteobacteria bacterium]|nr:rRNA pseudouridine synthase [Pseudomonadota bacterium]
MEERLQKVLARAGLASRRAAEKMILAGRVRVNGEVIDQLGAKADPERDRIEVDGRPIRTGTPRLYFMFNKPAGFLTTMGDPKGRPTVAGFLAGLGPGIFPVGRLDMDTEGLLILTNDGELAARLMHPRYHVPKTYRVKVEGHPSGRTLASLADGELMIGDRPAAPAEVEVIKRGTDRTWL